MVGRVELDQCPPKSDPLSKPENNINPKLEEQEWEQMPELEEEEDTKRSTWKK